MLKTKLALILAIVGLFAYNSCKKGDMVPVTSPSTNTEGGNGMMQVYLQDAPGPFDSVIINIQGVEVCFDSDTLDHDPDMKHKMSCDSLFQADSLHHHKGWWDDGFAAHRGHKQGDVDDRICINLPVQAGFYNLLDLQTATALIANGQIPAGSIINVIHLTLGTGNHVVINGVSYPLTMLDNAQINLNTKVFEEIASGKLDKVIIDFSVANSIIDFGDHRFGLRPFLTWRH